MRPDSCHGCPDNPRGSQTKEINRKMIDRYGDDLRRIERLHRTAARFRVELSDLDPLDFEMFLIWDREEERAKLRAGVRLF